jgi:hypothetical protein
MPGHLKVGQSEYGVLHFIAFFLCAATLEEFCQDYPNDRNPIGVNQGIQGSFLNRMGTIEERNPD